MSAVNIFTHSAEVQANDQAAWEFWTRVENWTLDVAIESVSLNGGFVKGSNGITKTIDGQLIEWKIVDVEDKRAVIEIPIPGAIDRFEWTFESRDDGRTRITQNISLSGEQAESFLPAMGQAFEQGIMDGMRRLAEEIDRWTA